MNRRLIFATTNPGKLANLRSTLEPAGYQVDGLEQYPDIQEAIEDGITAEENARAKARHYASIIGEPVLSMDSALYFHGLADAQQPGVNVRRIPGFDGRPTDEQMGAYYRELLEQNGGELTGFWEYALAYAKPDGTLLSQKARTEDRVLRLPGSRTKAPGQPLESFQIYAPTGQYLSELTAAQKAELWHEAGELVLQLVRQLVG